MPNYRFRPRFLLAGVALALAPAALAAQPADARDLLAARAELVAELVRSLPAELPPGAVGILPPERDGGDRVAPVALEGWAAAVAEALHAARPSLAIADRGQLEAVLREQKLGDSAYADPKSAAQVGKLVAARTLLLTRIHELRQEKNGRVIAALEASLVDVESGTNLWSRTVRRGLLPRWLKVALAIALAALLVGLLALRNRAKRAAIVQRELPRAKQEARIDVDALARAATDARERARAAGDADGAAALQKAWVEIDAALDRVRHALPGGAVDRSRARDLDGALEEAGRIAARLDDLTRDCGKTDDPRALAARLAAGAGELRAAVDSYRRRMA